MRILSMMEFWNKSRLMIIRLEKSRDSYGTSQPPRLGLLYKALSSLDLYYMALHQAYCLHSVSPTELQHELQSILDNGNCLGILQQLLGDNRNLANHSLQWLSQFPVPWTTMFKGQIYTNEPSQVQLSLNLMCQNWASFQQEVHLRCYPPLVAELVAHFGIISPVLQSVIFMTFVRRLYRTENGNEIVEKACQDLFEKDQQNHLRRIEGLESQYISATQVQADNEELIRGYMDLYSRYSIVSLPTPQKTE